MTKQKQSDPGFSRPNALAAVACALLLNLIMAQKAVSTDVTLDISYTDFSVLHPEVPNWTAQTWGETGLKNVMDSVAATGSRRIDFRSYAAGPYWPTQVSGAAACTVAATQGLSPDFSQWNCVQSAVTAAHRDGITTMGWFDLTEAHAGNPTAWALDHPQYCTVDRNGNRWDGPVGLVGNGGAVITRTNAPMMDYNRLISGGFMTANCLRPDGAPVDPVLSYAYPEVNQYRLASINEMLATGVDGIYLVAPFPVGYEAPVVTTFEQKYGIDPHSVPETDPRWIATQQGYFTDFIRQVHQTIVAFEQTTGRHIEFDLEGESSGNGPTPPNEPGWQNIPPWAQMPAWIDVNTIAQERLVDGLSYWTLNEIDNLSSTVRNNVNILTRYRYMGQSQADYDTRLAAAEARGVSDFIFDEAQSPLTDLRWMYPGAAGPLYDIAHGIPLPEPSVVAGLLSLAATVLVVASLRRWRV